MRLPPTLVSHAAGLLLAVAAGLPAQQVRNASNTGASTPATAARADNKRAMTIADIGKWRSIRDVAISDDGAWAVYGYQQRRVDDTLFIKNLSSGTEQKVPRASRAQFSDDAKSVAYFVAAAGANNREAAAGGEGANAPSGPARLELRNLATNAVVSWENVASFAFSKGSRALIIRKARPGAGPDAAAGRGGRGGGAPAGATAAPAQTQGGRGNGPAPAVAGTDMILHHLTDGVDELIGSVTAAEFNKPGSLLAYTVSTPERDGDGVYLVSTQDWQRRTLDNSRADYARLTWDESGTALATLRGIERRGFTEKENAVVAFVGVDGQEAAAYVLERKQLAGLPDSMVVSEKGTLSWSADRSKLFVGLKEQEARPPQRRDTTQAVEPVGNVDIWHWKDPYIQSVQMVRAQQDRNRTFTATVLLAQKKVVPLADEKMDRVQVTKDGGWAIGQDDKSYIDDSAPQTSDVYRTNTSTGERTPVLKAQQRTLGFSPDSKYFLYWKDKQIWAYDLAANKHLNLTAKAPVSFVDAEDDHVGDKPAYGIAGFTKDGKSVVLDHRHDLWLVSLDGSAAPRNLTNGVGSKNEIRFRYLAIDDDEATPAFGGGGGGRGGRGGAGATIDLSKPITLTAFGTKTKKAGFYQLDGDKLTSLAYEDRYFGRPIKAKNADRVLITRETYIDFPDYWVTNSKFADPQRLTLANPAVRVQVGPPRPDRLQGQGWSCAARHAGRPGRLSAGPEASNARVLLREAVRPAESLRGPTVRIGAAIRGLCEQRLPRAAARHLFAHRAYAHRPFELGRSGGEARDRPRLRGSEARRSPRRQLQRPGRRVHLDDIEDVRRDRHSRGGGRSRR